MFDLLRRLNLRPCSVPDLNLPPITLPQLRRVKAELLDILWDVEGVPRYVNDALDVIPILQSESRH
jgi:hypothetical protein